MIPRPTAYKAKDTETPLSAKLAAVSWPDFEKWLHAQYTRKHAHSMLNNAKKYHEAVYDMGKAAQLSALSIDMRRHAMQSLAALSKYVGAYDVWQTVKKQSGLKWERQKAITIVQSLLSEEGTGAILWLKGMAPNLPRLYLVPLVFAALTGLRPSEACKSCDLIYKLNKEGKLADYYDSELNMLQHYKYPQPFLRNTKNAYISFVSPKVVEMVANSIPTSYWAIHEGMERRGMPIRFKDLRKHYATLLRKSLEREMIDLVQGRVDGSVFVKHYYRPLIKELKDRVLTATAELEKELLPLLELPNAVVVPQAKAALTTSA